MALIKSTLSTMLEDILTRKPSAEEAAQLWAVAYVSFASSAMSSASSLATNAQGNLGILQSAFSNAFSTNSSAEAAAAISQGVMAFWSAIIWVGPTASGSTTMPGNVSLAASLSTLFSATAEKSESDKASELTDAFETGAKMVIVMDIPFIQPAPPIVGPIN